MKPLLFTARDQHTLGIENSQLLQLKLPQWRPLPLDQGLVTSHATAVASGEEDSGKISAA